MSERVAKTLGQNCKGHTRNRRVEKRQLGRNRMHIRDWLEEIGGKWVKKED